MIINDEKFKEKIVKEIDQLVNGHGVVWKKVTDDNTLDFMTEARYADTKQAIRFITIGYRVCRYEKTNKIIIYDYSLKKKNIPISTEEMPSIIIEESGTKGSMYQLLMKIKDEYDKEQEKKDQAFLDKYVLFLNSKLS